MIGVPPRLIRRIVLDPMLFVLILMLLALSPLVLLAAFVADLFLPGSMRTTRLLAVGVAFLAAEAVGLVVLFVLWVASGFGAFLGTRPFTDVQHRFVGWWLERLVGAARRFCRLRVELVDVPPARPGAVLVFPRHAGPGDSILIAHALTSGYQRRPRIVMKDTLQWSPTIDISGNRLGACFIRPADRNANRFVDRIGEIAADLGERDALVLFPEGGNFTVRRRTSAIAKLRSSGLAAYAERAEAMRNVVAPRPGGALAAMAAAPHADVVFVAHTGLEELSSFADLWKGVPFDRPIAGRYWRLPPDDVPAGRDRQIDWLYTWWSRIDTWIGSRSVGEPDVGDGVTPVDEGMSGDADHDPAVRRLHGDALGS